MNLRLVDPAPPSLAELVTQLGEGVADLAPVFDAPETRRGLALLVSLVSPSTSAGQGLRAAAPHIAKAVATQPDAVDRWLRKRLRDGMRALIGGHHGRR